MQNSELHVPAAAAFLCRFDFIPNWRIDDLMISFAPACGSAGRGESINQNKLSDFINKLKLDQATKEQLLQLTPHSYIGNATQQTLAIVASVRDN